MARKFVSPGVFTSETDLSFVPEGVGQIGAALVGRLPKGPAFTPLRISNYSDFVELFGDLDVDHVTTFAARTYLNSSSAANIVRVLGPSGRSVNGTSVTPGYTAESVWSINATGSVDNVMALLEITGSADLIIDDLSNDEFVVKITGSVATADTSGYTAEVTASFLTGSKNYIKKVLNTDATKFSELGYFVRNVYDYAFKSLPSGEDEVLYTSASLALTDFTDGYNSGSTPWIKSQEFGGSKEYNLFRIHTLGHGDVENGRFKVSIRNVRPSPNPSVNEFGLFDLEVRGFADSDKNKIIAESFPNLSLDPTDEVNYIMKRIGDKHWEYDATNNKMVEYGDFENISKFVRIEFTTGSVPDSALPWGFEGLARPVVGVDDTTSAIPELPYVKDLNDKATQAEAKDNIYWGVEFNLSGSILGRLDKLPSMTAKDTDFSLKHVSGSNVGTFVYNTSNPVSSQKSPGDSNDHTTLDPDIAKFTVPVAFGFDGFDIRDKNPLDNEAKLSTISQLGTQALRQAIDIVADPDFIDINLLALPGIYSSKVVDYGMDQIEDRSDALYVIDITGSTASAAVTEVKNRALDSSYAACYYPAVKVVNENNNKIVQVPASVAAVGALAYSDKVSFQWYAPAGLNRGGLARDTIGLAVQGTVDRLKRSEMDSLYENRINPIASFPGEGVVIWGQKTLQIKPSALDRVNVRRLLIYAKKLISSVAKSLVFEPNNPSTYARFRQLVNPILRDIQEKNGLEQFLVRFDSTTTTPDLIDRNVAKGKILLKPTRTTEFIDLDFVVSSAGASFDE